MSKDDEEFRALCTAYAKRHGSAALRALVTKRAGTAEDGPGITYQAMLAEMRADHSRTVDAQG